MYTYYLFYKKAIQLCCDCSGVVYISTNADSWENGLMKNIEVIDRS